MSGFRIGKSFLSDFGAGLDAPKPSDRSVFLRGDHSQLWLTDPAPGGRLQGRRLADWCCERANGVAPDLHLAGVSYWLASASGKLRAFYREARVLEQPGGGKRSVDCWRAIAAPDRRLLVMRLASRAGVPASAVEFWPTFADGGK